MKRLILAAALVAFAFTASAGQSAHNLVTAYAKAYGVPVKFALRVARIESGVRCGVGRRYAGPLQISLQSARGLGFRGTAKQLHRNCEQGTKYGMKHLAVAYRMAKGSQRCALRKHQAGWGARCR